MFNFFFFLGGALKFLSNEDSYDLMIHEIGRCTANLTAETQFIVKNIAGECGAHMIT